MNEAGNRADPPGTSREAPPSAIQAAQPLEAISLDLDDTLWPALPTLLKAEQTLTDWLAQHAPMTASAWGADARKSLRARIVAAHPERAHDMSWLRHRLLVEALAASGDDPRLAEPAFEVFLAARQQVTLYDDVETVLRRWASRYKLIAVSNGNADLARIGLGHHFSVVVSAHLVGLAKPDPDIFRLACARAGVPVARVFHIGDDFHLDYAAARRAGLQAGWLRRTGLTNAARATHSTPAGPATDPITGEAVTVFADLHQLDHHLQRLSRGVPPAQCGQAAGG